MAVEILESCTVTPGEGTPRHGLWLSILDLVVVRTHTPMVFFYRPGPGPAFFSPDILKAALSKALVPFYPLAGRLASDSADCTEINCTGDGVLFVTARADATLDDMGHSAPSDDLRRMFVPSAEDLAGILAMFQVTFFKCGGVCLGTAIHHMVSDGRAFGNFLRTWAAIARGAGEAAMSRPYLDRTLLRARSPPDVRFDHAELYPARGCVPSNPKVSFDTAILPISKNQVDALKGAAGAQGKKVSTFNAVVAHVWRCACEARGLRGTEDTRVYTTADVRSRIDPPLPDGYLGNAIIRTSAVAKANDIVSSPLDNVADKVSVATARLSDEYIRSLVNYLEQAMSDAAGLHLGQWAIPETDLWVVSWMGLSFSEVDFGWGRPAFIGRAILKLGNLVYLVPSPDGDGRLNITVSMEPQTLSRFKELFYQGLEHYSFTSQMHGASDIYGVKPSKL